MTTDGERDEAGPGGLKGRVVAARDLVTRDKLGSVLALGSSQAFMIAVSSVGLGFITQFVLARTLGTDSFGTYLYVTGWATSILLLVKLEFDTVAVRFVSAYTEGRPDYGKLRGLLRFVLTGSVGLATLVAIIGIVVLASRADWRATELGRAAIVGCLLLPTMTALLVSGGALQGFHRILEAQVPFYVIRPVAYIVGLGAVLLFGSGRIELTAPSALAINVAAVVLAILFSVVWLRRETRKTEWEPAVYHRREWTKTGVELLPVSLAQQALGQTTDVIVIGTMLTMAETGVYGVAAQIVMFVGFGVGAVATMAAPMIAALHEKGDKAELRRLMVIIGRVNLAYTLPAFAGLVLLGGFVLGIFGDDYRAGYLVLVILGVGPVTSVIGGPAGTMLTMTGFQRDAAIVVGSCAALNLTLSIILTLNFGVVGTACASVFSTSIRNVWLPIVATRRLGVSMLPW